MKTMEFEQMVDIIGGGCGKEELTGIGVQCAISVLLAGALGGVTCGVRVLVWGYACGHIF